MVEVATGHLPRIALTITLISMRAGLLALTLGAAIAACDSTSEPSGPDAAIGFYDKQSQVAQPRSANCGSGLVVDGAIELNANFTWLKTDIGSTPSGSSICGYIGGTWARSNATTIVLTPDPAGFPGFPPAEITVVGDDLTFPQASAVYKRRTTP